MSSRKKEGSNYRGRIGIQPNTILYQPPIIAETQVGAKPALEAKS